MLGCAVIWSQLKFENICGQPPGITHLCTLPHGLRMELSTAKAHIFREQHKIHEEMSSTSRDILSPVPYFYHPCSPNSERGSRIKYVEEPHSEILNLGERDGGYEVQLQVEVGRK